MSDKLENFIRNNREKLDQQTPSPDLWNNIQAGLSTTAAAGGAAAASSGGSTAAAAGKGVSGLAKLASTWKLAALAISTIIAATTIYFVAASGDGGKNDKQHAPIVKNESPNTDKKVEFQQVASPLVNPPLPEADIDYYEFSMNAKKGGKWVAPTGTVIEIPKGAFVDANGKPVKGQVDLRYREFHDGADIILSGIPMTYDDHGTEENFQTAGMMEILGYQDGEPIYIAEGKTVGVSIASFTGEDDYNLYYLDPEKGGWTDIGKAEIVDNSTKKKGLRLSPKAPKKPLRPSKAIPGVENENELGFTADYSEFPELKPFKNIRWEAADKSNMKKNQWAFTELWNDIKLEEVNAETNEYKIVLKNRRKKFEVNVIPILEGKDYDKAMEQFRKKNEKYQMLVKQRDQERSRLMAQADILRTFNVSGFGTYNCDRFLRMKDVLALNATFDFGEEHYMNANKTLVFHITGNNRSVVTYTGANIHNFRFSPSEINYLVAILPGSKVSIFSPKDFRRLDINEMRKAKEHEFQMTNSGTEVHNAADLRLILGV